MSEPNSVLRPVSEFKESYVRVRELGRGKFGVVYKVERKCDEDKDGGEKDAFAAKHVRYAQVEKWNFSIYFTHFKSASIPLHIDFKQKTFS